MNPPSEAVVEDLLRLSRTIGDPARHLAIIAEGNTSARLEGDRMLVKASGSWLSRLEAKDLVEVRLEPIVRLLDEAGAGDAEVARAFQEATIEREVVPPRPSVEAILHAVCLTETEASVIAHTHPVSVNGLLCSSSADLLTAGSLFPDQIVVLGRHTLLVPYVDPGLPLARHVRGQIRDFIGRYGTYPKVVYLRNHGMFALGRNSDEALQITEMAQKVALILAAAESAGGAVFMTDAEAMRIDSRPDEHHRRRLLTERVF
jgi:rhamnose utilization protein RhaD (predicted bifunctional aldolase and dehydrogenase)